MFHLTLFPDSCKKLLDTIEGVFNQKSTDNEEQLEMSTAKDVDSVIDETDIPSKEEHSSSSNDNLAQNSTDTKEAEEADQRGLAAAESNIKDKTTKSIVPQSTTENNGGQNDDSKVLPSTSGDISDKKANETTEIDEPKTSESILNLEKDTDRKISEAHEKLLHDLKQLEISTDVFAECRFWDFAGEKDYYATHQVFLNPYVLYLLVTNMTIDIKFASKGVCKFDDIAGNRNKIQGIVAHSNIGNIGKSNEGASYLVYVKI